MKNIYCKDLDTHQTLCYTYKCQGECTRSLSCTFSVLLTRKNEKGLCMSQFRLMHSPSFYGGNQVIVSIRTLSKKMRRKESRHSTAFFLRIFMLQLLWGRDIACRTPVESSDAVSRSYAQSPKASFQQVHWHCLD